jgi:hypothetical protein
VRIARMLAPALLVVSAGFAVSACGDSSSPSNPAGKSLERPGPDSDGRGKEADSGNAPVGG